MYELDKVQRIELAKILMNVLERGDWTELLTLTDSEIYLRDLCTNQRPTLDTNLKLN
jgi:hypothetical protein